MNSVKTFFYIWHFASLMQRLLNEWQQTGSTYTAFFFFFDEAEFELKERLI